MNPSNQKQRLTLGQSAFYQIEVQTVLTGCCAEMFSELTVVVHHEQCMTMLSGRVADQPALHGLLTRIRDLGLSLISVMCIEPE